MKFCWNLAMLVHLRIVCGCWVVVTRTERPSQNLEYSYVALYGKSLPTIVLEYSLDNVSIFI